MFELVEISQLSVGVVPHTRVLVYFSHRRQPSKAATSSAH